MKTYPQRWGFLDGPDKLIGKEIARAFLVKMEWGCTWDHAWVVECKDGTRAFFVGSRGSGIVNPPLDEVADCPVFLPAEYGEMAGDAKAEGERLRREAQQREREEYEKLKRKFG